MAPLRETDLLGVPSIGASSTPEKPTSQPKTGPDREPNYDAAPGGLVCPSSDLHRAVTLTRELQRLLARLPYSLKVQFRAFGQPLHALL